MQVPLQALALLLAGFDRARPRASYLLQTCCHLSLQAAILERHTGGRTDSGQQLGLVLESRVVQERCDSDAVPLDQGCCSTVVAGHLDRTAVEVGIALELRQPVRECHRRVAERASHGFPEVGRRRTPAQLDEQLPHRRTRKARVEEADEERKRREPDDEERGAPKRLEPDLPVDPAVDGGEEEQGDHRERESERVDEERARAP